MGFFQPTDEQIQEAISEGKRIVNYRWGTAWVSKRGIYSAFAWKVWLLAISIGTITLVILSMFSE